MKNKIGRIIIYAVLAALMVGVGIFSTYLSLPLLIGFLAGLVLGSIILKEPLWGVWLLTFFLPFERIGSVDLAGITIRVSQVVAALMIMAWLIRGFNLKKFKLRPVPIIWPIVLFLLVNGAAIYLNAPNKERSAAVLLFTVFTIAVSLILPQIIRHYQQIPRVIYILIGSMTVVCLFGCYQFLGDIVGLSPGLTGLRDLYTKDILGFPRIQSTALEPLYFANYLLIPLSILLALFLSKTGKIKSWPLVGLIALGGINLVLTVARGGYLAFAASLLVLFVFYFRRLFTWRNIIYGTLAIALIFLGAQKFLNLEQSQEDFFSHVTNLFGGASYEERVETFTLAQRAWQEHPWLGIGPGSFGPATSYHPYRVPENGYKIVNNEYLELLAETGSLGLALFVIMILILLVRTGQAWRQTKDKYLRALLVGLLAALVGILAQYNTFSVLYIMHVWWVIGMLLVVQNVVLIDRPK